VKANRFSMQHQSSLDAYTIYISVNETLLMQGGSISSHEVVSTGMCSSSGRVNKTKNAVPTLSCSQADDSAARVFSVWLSAGSLQMMNGASVNGPKLRVCAIQASIDATSELSAYGLGCGAGLGAGAGSATPSGVGGGGGHGGRGGSGNLPHNASELWPTG